MTSGWGHFDAVVAAIPPGPPAARSRGTQDPRSIRHPSRLSCRSHPDPARCPEEPSGRSPTGGLTHRSWSSAISSAKASFVLATTAGTPPAPDGRRPSHTPAPRRRTGAAPHGGRSPESAGTVDAPVELRDHPVPEERSQAIRRVPEDGERRGLVVPLAVDRHLLAMISLAKRDSIDLRPMWPCRMTWGILSRSWRSRASGDRSLLG